MRVLIVKLSSMGDIVHTLPALEDVRRLRSDIQFDWVVEKGFSEIPSWHSAVNRVIPIDLRRWRRNFLAKETFKEIKMFINDLRLQSYDLVIDAQGLLKSAIVTRLARADHRLGYNWQSAREPLASLFYNKTFQCHYEQHAINRIRRLFAFALQMPSPELNEVHYGITKNQKGSGDAAVIFFHGASGDKKLWPEEHWVELAQLLQADGYKILLPWGNAEEYQRAHRISEQLNSKAIAVLPRMTLAQLKSCIQSACFVVSVDTGLAHLTAAMDKSNFVLYAGTDPKKIGTCGRNQYHFIMADLTPGDLYHTIQQRIQVDLLVS